MVSNVSRVWKPDETLALVFEILLEYETFSLLQHDFSSIRNFETESPINVIGALLPMNKPFLLSRDGSRP